MRPIVRSRTSIDQLKALLDYGAQTFGFAVAQAKRARVDFILELHLSHFPRTATHDSRLGLYAYAYAISQTPFVVLYDFDDDELRVHFIVHGRAERRHIDPKSVV
jgi:plasmid stabilization system protein ParE